jgi:hypothetical protein
VDDSEANVRFHGERSALALAMNPETWHPYRSRYSRHLSMRWHIRGGHASLTSGSFEFMAANGGRSNDLDHTTVTEWCLPNARSGKHLTVSKVNPEVDQTGRCGKRWTRRGRGGQGGEQALHAAQSAHTGCLHTPCCPPPPLSSTITMAPARTMRSVCKWSRWSGQSTSQQAAAPLLDRVAPAWASVRT